MPTPNLIIPGFPKSGTSSLFDYLCQHPDIFHPRVKEPHTYAFDDRYKNRFTNQGDFNFKKIYNKSQTYKFIPDASTIYLISKHALKRINDEEHNNLKIIIMARDPIERVFSHYNWLRMLGYKQLKFKIEINKELKKTFHPENHIGANYKNYVEFSKYGKQLKKYFDLHLAYCYRPTKKALPSYYAEIHSGLPLTMKNNYELFLKDDRVNAYDIEKILEVITQNKLNLNIFKFDELIKGNLTLNMIFALSINEDDFRKKIDITKENTRTRKRENSYQVIDKTPSYPSRVKPILKKIERKFNISFKLFFKKNYSIEVNNSKFVDNLDNKNEYFFKKFIDAKR
ncbi:sulfotransferase domain-containing protein [Flavobacteriaceae bacterium 14752]|uniref:sulfotransferase domain-containing protein n=1 Tax=Mesohalobacter salilacus TaxID=2491711 RepID=UPI000F6401D2|nr:hypothetical protein EIG84_11350 [Flavobacteriaceae bacterium 14752]